MGLAFIRPFTGSNCLPAVEKEFHHHSQPSPARNREHFDSALERNGVVTSSRSLMSWIIVESKR
ncbi:hypothetical protein ZHAS_00019748 [Anopheles sinensis]|uniref:Uncharacterized protein n=1 Tax=Anopheles sinensis TaxID=74873 RepID=A0A084WN71_ANOSI|nr:hypothetical protein ZHAS_00019748 [Anopheles sinensis]